MVVSSCIAEKVCCICNQLKPASEYHRNARLSSGLCSQCKQCRKQTYKDNPQWRESSIVAKKIRLADPRVRKNEQLMSKYRITIDQYEDMVEKQGGVCKICSSPPGNKGLYVDHCHKSGEVRGLLCQYCNTLLGMAKDNSDILYRAIDYLLGANNGQNST